MPCCNYASREMLGQCPECGKSNSPSLDELQREIEELRRALGRIKALSEVSFILYSGEAPAALQKIHAIAKTFSGP